jgi:hypothetical protein
VLSKAVTHPTYLSYHVRVLPFPNYQLPITSLNRYDKCSTGHDITNQILVLEDLRIRKNWRRYIQRLYQGFRLRTLDVHLGDLARDNS